MKNVIIVSILCVSLSVSLGFGAMALPPEKETYYILNLDQENATIQEFKYENIPKDIHNKATKTVILKYYTIEGLFVLEGTRPTDEDISLKNTRNQNIRNNIASIKKIFDENKCIYFYTTDPNYIIYYVIGYSIHTKPKKPSPSWLQSLSWIALPAAALAAGIYLYLNYWKNPSSSLNNASINLDSLPAINPGLNNQFK